MELWLTNKKTLFPMISGKKKKKKVLTFQMQPKTTD